jgi:hypothetical protein
MHNIERNFDGMGWIHLAQQCPVTNTFEHGEKLSGSIKGWEFLE